MVRRNVHVPGGGDSVGGILADLRKACAAVRLDVPLDFKKEVYEYGAAEALLMLVIGANDKQFLVELFDKILPDKVKRRNTSHIGNYLLQKWPKQAVRSRLLSFTTSFAQSLTAARYETGELDDYEEMMLYCFSRITESGDPVAEPDENLISALKKRYEIVMRIYHLNVAGHDPGFIRESELHQQYTGEITRLKEKAQRAGKIIQDKTREAEAEKENAANLMLIIEEQEKEIRSLKERIGHLERELARAGRAGETPPPLAGKVICVVGAPARQEGYRRILEARGARLRFVDGITGFMEAPRVVGGVDGLIMDIAYAQHQTTLVARTAADKKGIPVAVCPISGNTAFENTVSKLVDMFAPP